MAHEYRTPNGHEKRERALVNIIYGNLCDIKDQWRADILKGKVVEKLFKQFLKLRRLFFFCL